MFMRRPKYRVFDYTPRFYNPETDEKERIKRKLGFTRKRKYIGKRRSPVIWLVFILTVIYLFFKFGGNL